MVRVPSRVIESGRVTIPKETRAELGLEKGDYVIIDVEPVSRGGA